MHYLVKIAQLTALARKAIPESTVCTLEGVQHHMYCLMRHVQVLLNQVELLLDEVVVLVEVLVEEAVLAAVVGVPGGGAGGGLRRSTKAEVSR